jgi:adenosylcobyric acid synthase
MTRSNPPPPGARIAIVRLPCLSNATDFRLLTWADWITSPPAGDYDFIVLPGTKSTIPDLLWLKASGLAEWILAQHRRGATVVGICGGFQMLGIIVQDPHGVDSRIEFAPGLALLPITTVMSAEKQTAVNIARTRGGVQFSGYEIHMGATEAQESLEPFARLDDGREDGACAPGVIGTYLHGALEHPDVCAELFGVPAPVFASKHEHYERLADWFDTHGRHLDRLGLT